MTVSSTVRRNDYAGSGITGPYPYTFRVVAVTDLRVSTVDAAGVETVLAFPSGYSVVGVGNGAGGSITLTTAAPIGSTVIVQRVVPLTQGTDFRNQGPFFAEIHEDALDRLTMVAQQLQDQITPTFRAPSTVNPASLNLEIPGLTPNSYLRVNNGGTGLEAVASVIASQNFLQSGTGATTRTMNAKAADVISVKDFGAVGDGVTDDTAAIRAAVVAAAAVGVGAGVFFPSGRYLTDEISITTDGISLAGAGMVRLLARANGQVILRIAASYCGVERLWLDANGHTTVDGLVLAPSNEADNLTRVDQNYNRIRHLHIEACANGIRMRCGPGTVSGDSGCWYNTVEDIDARNCTRGLFLQRCVSNAGALGATGGSLVNRNHFKNFRIGQATNVGVHIEAGGTNTFMATSLEGVNTGVSPIATPTGIYITASDPQTGGNNDDNHFYGTQNEANTRDIYCDDPYTVFMGCNSIGGSKLAGAFFAANQGLGIMFNSAYVKQHLPGPLEYDPSLNSNLTPAGGWTCGVPFIPQQGVGKYGGITATIANGATVDLTLTNARHPLLLMIGHNANPGLMGAWFVCGDGTNPLNLSTEKSGLTGSSFTLAVISATVLRITNSTGSSCHFSWGACPFGPAL